MININEVIETNKMIDNVTVDLTIKNVTIKSDGASGWNLAGIYLKGQARLNLTLQGTNTLVGLDDGAGIEVANLMESFLVQSIHQLLMWILLL